METKGWSIEPHLGQTQRGALLKNVNYAIKSTDLLNFLEFVPGVEGKLKPPLTADWKFVDALK